ncbi:MAG: hypothetical protein PHS41_08885 [Victivallaceae bacterium]|nr:hypothetical protein [Victivallaceae bacterium]
MATVCPYCNIEVSESQIEAEDGCCPECGAMLGVGSSIEPEDRGDRYDEGDDFNSFDDDDDDDFENSGEFDDELFEDEEFGDFDEDMLDEK